MVLFFKGAEYQILGPISDPIWYQILLKMKLELLTVVIFGLFCTISGVKSFEGALSRVNQVYSILSKTSPS